MPEEKQVADFGKPLMDARKAPKAKTDQDYLKTLLELTKKDARYYARTTDEMAAVNWALGKLGHKNVEDFQKSANKGSVKKIKEDNLAGKETAEAMLKKLQESGNAAKEGSRLGTDGEETVVRSRSGARLGTSGEEITVSPKTIKNAAEDQACNAQSGSVLSEAALGDLAKRKKNDAEDSQG